MISTLGGSRSPPASEVEMHDRANLLEIAAFVVILRNSTGGADQLRTQSFCA